LVGAEVEVGLNLGPVEDPSAICLHGRGRGRCSVSEGDPAGVSDGRAIRMLVHGSHGFRDGGGSPRASMGPQAMDILTRHIRSTHNHYIGKQMNGG
jgi:hypothetical protein